MIPAYNEKALVLGDYLVISDLHIGLERELSKNGIRIPPQLGKMEARIVELLKNTGREKLVILGDLKHNVPMVSWMEHNEIPSFVERLSEHAEIVLVKGNHDGSIEKIAPNLSVQRELEVDGKALLIHGHTKPGNIDYNYIVMGHNHPCIEFRGELGYGSTESAWIRMRLKKEYIRSNGGRKNPEVIVMPAFNDLIYGMPFNRKSKELLGPLFRSGLVELEKARAYLLDGTFLGRIKDLRRENEELA